MIRIWILGMIGRRLGWLTAQLLGVAVAVALLASLGVFLTSSKSTMTTRAVGSVVVDWQVQVTPGADAAAVARTVAATAGTEQARTVTFAQVAGFQSTTGGSTQTTGAGVVVGVPPDYAATFRGEVRPLSGSAAGVLLAQQTASNLHAAPGDWITLLRPGLPPVRVTVNGVIDLPQADSLFQKVGAPPQSQPAAPPDNVLMVPDTTFSRLFAAQAAARPDTVTTQVHVLRSRNLPPDPAESYTTVTGQAHHLEAVLAGAGTVGDNLAAALDGARKDALYAQVMFLFLGLPGAVLAALLTVAVAGAGAVRRRRDAALLRARGAGVRQLLSLAVAEAAVVGVAGGAVGIVAASLVGRWAFGSSSFGATPVQAVTWTSAAFVLGLVVAAASLVVPAVRDLRSTTVSGARRAVLRDRPPLWMRWGVDLVLLVVSALVFWVTSRGDYTLVLAPEGVATISVSYWAFLGPALLWLGAGLLAWRVCYVCLARGRRPLAAFVRPLTGRLALTTAAGISRQRSVMARSVVLVALALSFAGSTAVFNTTYRQQAEVDARLTNGADVAVTESPGSQVGPAAARQIAAVPGVVSVEPVQHRFAYVGADLQDLFGVRPRTIGAATSLQDAYFQGGTAKDLMSRLAARPDSILVSDETVKDFQLSLGDLIKLRLQDGRTRQLTTVSFHYVGVAKEFPTAPKDSFFVANADYIAKATGSDAVGSFLVSTAGSNQAAVAAAIQRALGTSAAVTAITSTRAVVGSSLTSVDLAGLTRVELAFALVLAAGAGGLVLALGLAERRRGFAIASVLGATGRQLRGQVLSEAAVVTVGGLVAGVVGGWLLAQMLVKVLTGVFDPPPDSVAVPWVYLLSAVAVTVIAIAVAGLLAARHSRRPAIEELRTL